ncbi:hypothetical protein MD484_g2939, partial [Candolleomyces efflorescens]
MDVSGILEAQKAKQQSVLVEKETPLEVDAGHLMVYDINPIDEESYNENLEEHLQNLARDGIQVLIGNLFSLPITKSPDGPLAQLPPSVYQLPRAKPLPKPKPPTKWERFAAAKGISHKKRDRKEWDEERQEWVNRWGKDGRNKQAEEQWATPVPHNADADYNPQLAARKERKERIAKNEKQRLANIARANGESASSSLKDEIERTLATSRASTASMGRFDKKLEGEKKLRGVKRKYEPTEMPTEKEQKANLNLIARMDSDARKMRTHPQAEESVLNARKAIRSASKGRGSAALVASFLSLAVQAASAKADASRLEERGLFDPVCRRIADEASSATKVYYPPALQYLKAIHHWSFASTELSDCVVEPATPEDVGRVLQIVGETRTPFAVKGGGHSTNPGFSSTKGVHISMVAFSQVTYDASSQTAQVGAGLVWDDVYEALEPYGVNVVGGRVSGVGVAGFTLGGGFSWKTNQYGLTVDTVEAYELVKPDGTVSTVTEGSDSELFFGLKGGLNNFGIVTKFTLKTHPQTNVWGGLITFTKKQIPDVTAATAEFSASVTDPKASIITTYNFVLGAPGISLLLFYDGPTPPAGIFDHFLQIPHFTRDVKTRTFLDLVKTPPSYLQANQRGLFQMVPVLEYTPSFINAVVNQSEYWGNKLGFLPNVLGLRSGMFFSYAVEPFLPNIYAHSTNPTAYPYSRSRFFSPFNIYFSWLNPLEDDLFQKSVMESARALLDAAQSEGQSNLGDVPLYPNYATGTTPVEVIYGDHLGKLRALKARVDPDNVMGLAGGFKL